MTTKLGNAKWAVFVSTGQTGTAGSETPTGDLYYFDAMTVKGIPKSLSKTTHAANGLNIKYPNGSRKIVIRCTDCHMPPEAEPTSTEELGELLAFFHSSSVKIGASPVYLWIQHKGEDKYLPLSHNASNVQTRYLKGHFNEIPYKLTDDDFVWVVDFTFEEADFL